MSNITDDELAALEAVRSAKEWDAACDRIKAAREGVYPPDWWERVNLSGMMHRILSRWK